MERRINSRLPADFAAKARREFWTRKQAESEQESQLDKAANQALVSDWLVRFHFARNSQCQAQKNFRGVN